MVDMVAVDMEVVDMEVDAEVTIGASVRLKKQLKSLYFRGQKLDRTTTSNTVVTAATDPCLYHFLSL